MAIHEPGGPKDDAFLKHVKELNEKLNGNSHTNIETRTSIFKRLRAIFKR